MPFNLSYHKQSKLDMRMAWEWG